MSYTIGQIADEFGLTHRTLRFWEEKYKLVTPARAENGVDRVYSENDRLRVGEVVRGAKYGLSLREIAGMIEEGPTGPWLHVPAKRAAELVEDLVVEHTRVTTSIYDLKRIAAGEPVGAFPDRTATSVAPGAEKRTADGPRKGGGA